MAKYRNLTKSELTTFEKEFVDYLVVNGIIAEDWEKIKLNEKEKAEKIIDLFSDVILESVFRNAKFMEIHTKTYIQAIQCLPNKMIMVALNCTDSTLSIADYDKLALNGDIDGKFEMHQGEKVYKESRELALFKMTEQGFTITNGELFKKLILATV